jgi:enterochelin esterase-like enzyme
LNYKGKDLYFRGDKIVKKNLEWLNSKYNLFNDAKEVIVTGGSAGGIATFLWGNYIKSLIKTTNYKIVIDSGVFLNHENSVTK